MFTTTDYVRLVRAAPLLGVTVETLRDWIAKGAPHVNLGPCKGRGYRVNVAAMRAWCDARVGHNAESRAALALWRWRRG